MKKILCLLFLVPQICFSQTQAELALPISDQKVKSIYLTHDESKLITFGDDKNIIKIWDVENEKLLQELTGHTSKIKSVVITKEEDKIISYSDNEIKIWDINSGELYRPTIILKDAKNTNFLFMGSKNKIIITQPQYGIQIMDVDREADTFLLANSKNIDEVFLTSKEDKLIGYATTDKAFVIWDMENRDILQRFNFEDNMDVISDIILAKEDKIISIHKDSTIRIWDINNSASLQEFKSSKFNKAEKDMPYPGFFYGASLRSRTEGFVIQNSLRTFKEYSIASWFSPPFYQFSKDYDKLLLYGDTTKVWDVDSGILLEEIIPEDSTYIYSSIFNHEGDKIILMLGNYKDSTNRYEKPPNCIIWDVQSEFDLEPADAPIEFNISEFNSNFILINDRNQLITIEYPGLIDWYSVDESTPDTFSRLTVRNISTGDVINTFKIPLPDTLQLYASALSMRFIESKNKIAYYNYITGGDLHILDLATGSAQSFGIDIPSVFSAPAFYYNRGKLLYAARGVTEIWNLKKGELESSFKGNTSIALEDPILIKEENKVIFYNKTKFEYTNSPIRNITNQAYIKICDLNTGLFLNNIQLKGLHNIRLSKNKDKIFSLGGINSPIKIWDVHSGELLNEIPVYVRSMNDWSGTKLTKKEDKIINFQKVKEKIITDDPRPT